MATFQKSVKIAALFLNLLALFANSVTANNEPNCVNTRNRRELFQRGEDYEPCANTRGRSYVRDLECPDGSTIHTCCKTPYREEVQTDRQVWFRTVIAVANAVGRKCVSQVFCEQSCKDGLNGLSYLGRSSYPEVLPGDTRDVKEYVDAWNKGEAWAACGLQSREDKRKNGTRSSGRIGENSCDEYCQHLSPECEQVARLRFLPKFFYDTARFIHLLGMTQFNRDWRFRTQMMERWTNQVQVGYALRQAFRLALIRMSRNINKICNQISDVPCTL